MYAIIVTIGRNEPTFSGINHEPIGPRPMSDARWTQFIADVRGELEAVTFVKQRVMMTTTEGIGEWDGIPEPNAQVTVLLRSQISDENKDLLRRSLSELARLYEQEAIAVMFATSELC